MTPTPTSDVNSSAPASSCDFSAQRFCLQVCLVSRRCCRSSVSRGTSHWSPRPSRDLPTSQGIIKLTVYDLSFCFNVCVSVLVSAGPYLDMVHCHPVMSCCIKIHLGCPGRQAIKWVSVLSLGELTSRKQCLLLITELRHENGSKIK